MLPDLKEVIPVKSTLIGAVTVAVLPVLVLTACSPAASPAEPVTLSLGNVLTETHPWNKCGMAELEKSLEAAGVGIEIDLFPAGQTQADTQEQLDALQSGSLDLTLAGPAQLATRLEKLNIFDAAYLFETPDQLLSVTNGEIGQELFEELREASGLRVLSTGYYGTRHVTANKAVRSPDDLTGVKMRVIDAPLWIANGEALGATPTAVAFAELYLALQQGVVDAQENPLPTIAAQKFLEVQSHISLTGHNVGAESIVVSDGAWDRLSEAQQTALAAAAKAGADAATKCVADEEEALLAEWSDAGSGVTVVSDVDLTAFQDRAQPILLAEFGDVWGDLYERIRAAS